MNKDESFSGLSQALRAGQLSRRQMLGLLAVAGGGVLTGCAVNPVTGERQFSLISPAQEVSMDREHAPKQISADYGVTQDRQLQSYVTQVGEAVGQRSHRPEMPYSYNALNANYVNAYAFPGGTIGITRGILLEMETEAELAALIGHEVAHVSARHTAQRMSTQTLSGIALAGAGLLVASQLDDSRAALALGIGSVAAGALLARYSRGDERQADSLGMEYMVKANHNPQGMVDLMDMLNAQGSRNPTLIEQMFSSHPMSQDRYNAMRAEARQKYASASERSQARQRYMDNTSNLRRLKPAIELQRAGETAMVNKDFAGGEQQLAAALKRAPNDYTGLVLMAKAKIVQNDLKGAKPFLQKAHEVYPEEAQAKNLLGAVEMKLGNLDQAIEELQVAEQLLPDNPNTRFLLAVCHDAAGHSLEAQAGYQQLLHSGVQGPVADYARSRLV